MRTHMHERVDIGAVPQPQPEGQQGVPRGEHRVVIVRAASARSASIGWERHQNIAERADAESEHAVTNIGIARGIAPSRVDSRGCIRRQLGAERGISIQREPGFAQGRVEYIKQGAGRFRHVLDAIARKRQVGEERQYAGRNIQPDRIAVPPRRSGIMR